MFKVNKEILTNNYRISQLIQKYNRREDYPIVDNKILTAKKAESHNVPVPKNYLFIQSHGQLKQELVNLSRLETSFVVKPAEGSQGGGILIINSVTETEDFNNAIFHTSRLGDLTLNEFKHYLSGILSGLYSLRGHKDYILVQEKISNIDDFRSVTNSGIPDVRVIVFMGFPVMAMIRFPTLLSGGRGNLHLGAVGCGIHLKTGEIFHSIQNNRTIHEHPDTQKTLSGLKIPLWDEILLLASRSSEMARIGYLGVDIVIDKIKGPLLLEMNARPGLSIQLANQRGLRGLLDKVLKQAPRDLEFRQRVKWALEVL